MSETPIADPDFDADDLLAIGTLTASDIEAIDCALMKACKPRWLKVAMVVGEAMDAYPDKYHDVPDIFYSQRVRELVKAGKIESQGNLFFMRFSEVCLPFTKVTDEA